MRKEWRQNKISKKPRYMTEQMLSSQNRNKQQIKQGKSDLWRPHVLFKVLWNAKHNSQGCGPRLQGSPSSSRGSPLTWTAEQGVRTRERTRRSTQPVQAGLSVTKGAKLVLMLEELKYRRGTQGFESKKEVATKKVEHGDGAVVASSSPSSH